MSSQAVIFSIMIKYNKCNKSDIKAETIIFECKNEKEKEKEKKQLCFLTLQQLMWLLDSFWKE